MKRIFNILFLCFVLLWSITSKVSAQALINAVQGQKVEEVKALLAKGTDPNVKSGKETALGLGMYSKYPEIPTMLINAKGIKINEWNYYPQPEITWKYTALMKAIKNIDLLKLLVEKGALIDLQDDDLDWQGVPKETGGNTALMLAVRYSTECYVDAAKYLIEKGAKLDIQSRFNHTALMYAVHNTEISKLLIDKGAKIDLQNSGGETALMLAADKYTDVVKLLLDKGANISLRQTAHKSTPNALDRAVIKGNLSAAKLIMARAVELGIKDEIISGSLHWAVVANQLEMVKYLLDEGALIEGTDTDGGYTPLMNANNLEIVQLLVKRGANVNAYSKFGYTPLNKAIANFLDPNLKDKDNEKILSLLLDKGAKVDVQDGNGSTALMYAVQKNTPFKMLIDKGANVNIQNKSGETALMLAVKGGLVKVIVFVPIIDPFKDAVKILIGKNADLELKDNLGKTALIHAAGALNAKGDDYASYTEMVQFLLEKGANIEAEDKDKNTALYWAQRYNRTKTADLLIAKGAKTAKKYERAKDKSNVEAGIVGIWQKIDKVPQMTLTTRVVFKADWTYSKSMKTSKGDNIPDGGGYTTYDIRDGRIFLFNATNHPAVVEFRFEGKTLILNGEKFTKAVK